MVLGHAASNGAAPRRRHDTGLGITYCLLPFEFLHPVTGRICFKQLVQCCDICLALLPRGPGVWTLAVGWRFGWLVLSSHVIRAGYDRRSFVLPPEVSFGNIALYCLATPANAVVKDMRDPPVLPVGIEAQPSLKVKIVAAALGASVCRRSRGGHSVGSVG
jgi:hypothetical protein